MKKPSREQRETDHVSTTCGEPHKPRITQRKRYTTSMDLTELAGWCWSLTAPL